jgi:hypothetical protein
MNMMKMVQYDEVHTRQLLAINRLTYAPKVLKRYIELKKVTQKQYPQTGHADHRRNLHTVKVPRANSYFGGDYIDVIIEKSRYATKKYIDKVIQGNRNFYKIELEFDEPKHADDLYDSARPLWHEKGYTFSDAGVWIPEHLKPKTYSMYSLLDSGMWEAKNNTFTSSYTVPTRELKYPENSDAVLYLQGLSATIESIMDD